MTLLLNYSGQFMEARSKSFEQLIKALDNILYEKFEN